MRKALPLLLLPLALLAGRAFAAPDAHLTGRFDTDDFVSVHGKSQAANNGKVEIWIGADRVRSEGAGITKILRLDQKRLYSLDATRRVYAVEKLKSRGHLWERVPSKDAISLDKEAQELMRPRFTPLSTHEARKIGSWQAERYDGKVASQMRQGRYRVSWWLAPEVKVEDQAYRQLLLLETPELEPLLENPGFPVLRETFVEQPGYEVKSSVEIQKIETREAPAGLYDPPDGYRLVGLQELMFPGE